MTRRLKHLAQILFSIWVWGVSFGIMTIVAILTFALLPIFPYRKTHSWIASPGFALCLRLTFSRIRVTYDDRFDPQRRSIFCMNHTNLLDAHTGSTVIPHPFCGLMDAWQFKIPIYGWMMKVSRSISIKRGEGKNNLPYLVKEATQRRKEGFSILTFPEGHRTRNGHVRVFRRGIFFMARDAGYPVVPIAVRGMYAVNRRGSRLFRPGDISIHVGPQIETANLTDQQIRHLAKRLQKEISDFVENHRSPEYSEAIAV